MARGRLYRSRHNRVIAGVAGGLADYFAVDVIVIRLLWIMAFFMGGGFIAYLIAWFIIPEQPSGLSSGELNYGWARAEGQGEAEDPEQRWRRGGIILIVVGIFFLLRALIPWPSFRDLAPFFLIIVGVIILLGGFKKNG